MKNCLKLFLLSIFIVGPLSAWSQAKPQLEYTLSIPFPESHKYHVELHSKGWNIDTLVFKMPKWMPGYYQIMDYDKSVENIQVTDEKGKPFPFQKVNDNTFRVAQIKNKSLVINYDVMTARQFVANSYVDTEHAYLIPANTFFY